MFDESFEGLSANDPEVATAQMTAKMKEFLLDDALLFLMQISVPNCLAFRR